ncbi:MAG: hypothetical protein AMJ46_01850 [Latescibacteria bacterium DG_63]|nr:MAG: hypothetical protein AMJ46_01850 [Latescibacteria bacterium DG_63]
MKSWLSIAAVIVVAAIIAFSVVDGWAAQQVKRVQVPSSEKGIPIEWLAHLTVVEAFINDQGPYKVVLDTGAGVSVLTREIVKELEIPVVGSAKIGSPMGTEPLVTDSLNVRSIRMGDAVMKNAPAVTMDLRTVFGSLEAPDAILSAASFDGFVITLDFPNDMILVRAGELPAADGKRVLEYSSSAVVPQISVLVAGEEMSISVDTGAPSAFVLPPHYISVLPLESEPTVSGHGRTVDATFEILSSKLEGVINIGDIALLNPTVTFSERTKRAHVGMGVLREYAITIDSANRRIRFDKPLESTPVQPVRRVVKHGGPKSYGIMLNGLSGEVLEVRGVEQGLAAASAGLQRGDRIVAMNGQLVKSLSSEERVRHLRGTPLTLKVERKGEVIEIVMSLD